jgi:hypothetical protein
MSVALAKVKPNSGNRAPGSSSGRYGHRAVVKDAANKLRREDAKRDVLMLDDRNFFRTEAEAKATFELAMDSRRTEIEE